MIIRRLSPSISRFIDLPSSKSVSNRVLLIRALADSQAPITRLADCDDTRVMQAALDKHAGLIDIGAAGTAMRFLTAYFAAMPGNGEITLDGTARMRERPIKPLTDALTALGADIRFGNQTGFPPVIVNGRTLKGGEVTVDGSVSSQFISALLLVAPTMKKGLTLHIEGHCTSIPYIYMTIFLMQDFGIKVRWVDEATIKVKPGKYHFKNYTVEADWSAASYWLALRRLLPDSNILLNGGLNARTTIQGDSAIEYYIEKSFNSEPFVENLNNTPDLAQTLVVMLALLNKPFTITGLETLKIKETDRLLALKAELAKLGYNTIDITDDSISYDGTLPHPIDGLPVIDTYHDHRMAMAFSLAAARFPAIDIRNPEVVSKSYPEYWVQLLGPNYEENT